MTVRVPIVGVLGVAVALALSPGAGAATVKVNCSTGGNLQSKINSAPAGSTILIKGTCIGSFIASDEAHAPGQPDRDARRERHRLGLDHEPAAAARSPHDQRRIGGQRRRDHGGRRQAHSRAHDRLRQRRDDPWRRHRRERAGRPPALGRLGEQGRGSAGGVTVNAGGIAANSVTMTDSAVRYNVAHAIGATNPTYAQGGGIVLIYRRARRSPLPHRPQHGARRRPERHRDRRRDPPADRGQAPADRLDRVEERGSHGRPRRLDDRPGRRDLRLHRRREADRVHRQPRQR